MPDNSEYLVVFTTCPTQESATTIAKALVDKKIAACVQISSPVTSYYCWDGEVCNEQEISLQIKCLASCYDLVEQEIIAVHPYQCPELVALPIIKGLPAYLNWLRENSQS